MSVTFNKATTPIVLTIAGSDSGGGAGIQADIKAISATGGYACSVITAITAQNTLGVSAVHPIPLPIIEKQLDAVFSDLNIVAVKVGMLADSDIIELVAAKIRQYQPRFLVVDPVMIATSGDPLLKQTAIETLKTALLPLADIITPNLPEAAALTQLAMPNTQDGMLAMIDELRLLAAESVLLKGGHLECTNESNDVLILPQEIEIFSAPRIQSRNTHGTGCTLSSAIASYLAQGYTLMSAVQLAKHYITSAIEYADQLDIGHGHGPVDHFFALRSKTTNNHCS
ncbi:bifunctional hydroxymethylpyrimidine kinase/phosphomethylpyrimidine kinase [Photobacterium leiognathi]|uniref:bifunctional hydroxymethylpyrimidine kinase/phosphomethylpyrimidine kinase n=1 Tax=Photobacterium leiognathi TaxID=553611 RepID=UPI00298292D9|nr:bifunctional hydroxymethylpyrimidine kinase/phosphomethylpyrimidine kinase [Photobacterium leiognathi]